ncbi:LuxR C-terminal-related transcriptional regulator [Paenibacillus dokdonensis]|uniref:LuxR C-terminal-related transcriptional regulator n=1 Tax=Paenibacillus dokdonensis TaxID=2567944 RepID=A0ABU6GY86_9BACL|nr:LuxR C-terminal-related transcriptional regulator [Paenibacillus dokdonensis]MEC0244077.1 LuxR C-terminal-related transcriptional regulator [Paenibacillus dokdonensis]
MQRDSLSTETPLLRSKINIPRTISTIIVRPRLAERLEHARRGRLTLVCAPAGFGKTTLISEWIPCSPGRSSWVSLDAGDNTGTRFWHYIAAAVDMAFPGYYGEVKPVLSGLHSVNFEQEFIMFLNALERLDDELLLVLDDFHVIQDKQLLHSFSYFVEHLPPQIHICLLSRTEPGFSMTRMEARQLAFRLDAEDLRFTKHEGAEFFRKSELRLNAEAAALLLRKTEGWITGLKLAAIAMRREEEKEAFIREFAGDSREVKQYLLEEVFSGQSEHTQSFLIQTSILKRWNASLCEAVTGFTDSLQLIEALERSHLFVVSLDQRSSWLRYHHLFADFLLQRLGREKDYPVNELYRRAGAWCHAQGLDEEAVEYYLSGGYYNDAIRLLGEMTSRVVHWEWSNLQKWLSAIPSDILLQHPVLFFSYANALIAEDSGDIAEGEKLLRQSDDWYDEASGSMSEEEKSIFLAMSHYVQGTLMVFGRNNLQLATEHYEKVVRYAPGGIQIIFGLPEKPLQPVTVKSYKIGYGHASRSIAEPYTMQMAELYRAVNPIFLGKLFLNHAEVLYYWNDLSGAASYASEAMHWIRQNFTHSEHDLVPCWILQAKLKAAGGHLQEALEILEDGRSRMKWMDISRGRELLELEQIRLQMQYGLPAPAQAWLEGCHLSSHDKMSVFELYDYQLLARVLLLQKRLDEAAPLLERLLYLAEREMRPIDAAENLCIRASLLLARGEKEKAMYQLEEALRISEANDFVRIFLDENAIIHGLVRELAQAKRQGHYRGKDASSLHFLRMILAETDLTGDKPDSSPLEALLTAREMDVFQGLLDQLSGKEIAAKLNITYETVKTHRGRIYSKLGAANRNEAIRRAQELGGVIPAKKY